MRRSLLVELRAGLLAAAVGVCALSPAQVPLDGYYPLVGIGLSDEFDDDFNFFPFPEFGLNSGDMLGPAGTATYDLALLDTGAGFSVMSSDGFDHFDLGGEYPGERDGYRGTESVPIGGATGQLNAAINDPFGLYVGGLQQRTASGAGLTLDNAALHGQTNTATITLPAESDLPNIVGLPFASQYATHIRSDQPQIFQLDGRTIRTPSIDFQPLGSGGGDIVRRAPLNLNPGPTFAQPPAYLPNIVNFDIDNPQENPTTPTIIQGGLFLNVQAENDGGSLGGTQEFFFDTGASVTVVSQLNALNLGFDVVTDEPEFTISIVGSGGILSDVPGFFVEEFTILALGGSITLNDVPVIVLDVADPSDAGNVVEGIVGTNLLAGRNVVIDPVPALGAGGNSAGVYISDPVTADFQWAAASASAPWSSAGAWDAAASPDLLSVARVAPVGGADQQAVVPQGQAVEAWSATVEGGPAGQTMTVRIEEQASLTTFSGVAVAEGGVVKLEGGVLDAQYVDVRGGRLEGAGQVRTGSGPIEGQVEAIDGVVAPLGELEIEGRFLLGSRGALEVGLYGAGADDQLAVSGTAAFDGDLVVTLHHIPTLGQRFELVTHAGSAGEFDNLTLPAGYEWELEYGEGSLSLDVVGLMGDFNADGRVDAADYTVWSEGLGSEYTQDDYGVWASNYGALLTHLAGDFTFDGVVDALDYLAWRDGLGTRYTLADYNVWESNYGASLSSLAVPEPSAGVLLFVGAAVFGFGRRSAPHAAQ